MLQSDLFVANSSQLDNRKVPKIAVVPSNQSFSSETQLHLMALQPTTDESNVSLTTANVPAMSISSAKPKSLRDLVKMVCTAYVHDDSSRTVA